MAYARTVWWSTNPGYGVKLFFGLNLRRKPSVTNPEPFVFHGAPVEFFIAIYIKRVSYRPKSDGHHAGETIAFSQEYLIMDLVPMSRFSSGHVVFIKSILMINEG
jgi:hypothetical protein